jgi:hypothetical protein
VSGRLQERGRADDEVVGTRPQAGRERPVDAQREAARGLRLQPVADRGEGDEAVEQVVAVGPPAGDVQREVDLGPRRFRETGAGLVLRARCGDQGSVSAERSRARSSA